MRYIPNSQPERQQMLESIGLRSEEDLFRSIPDELKLNRSLNVPGPLAETEVINEMERMSQKNSGGFVPSFLGAGVYSHYSPTIVDHLIQRSEFFTAYTPYQPEISQGTLQYIFEFQTLICQLTAMEVANASMYDGSTALAEAVLMAQRVTRKNKILVAKSLHPEYLEVAKTYTKHLAADFQELDFDPESGLVKNLDGSDNETAAIVIQSPNFFGCIENLKAAAEAAHSVGALLIVVVSEGISLGLLEPPGSFGADIVVGEGQSFGVPMSFGGPHVGFFATREKFIRQMPGRLCGIAYDKNGNRGFVLTLSTREQHIRREKATSNICTNQGLIALAATIYLETMGKKGLREVAQQNLQKAHYCAERLSSIDGFELKFKAPWFNEFVLAAPVSAKKIVDDVFESSRLIAGLPLSRYFNEMDNQLLVCVTETSTKSQIDALVEALSRFKA
ncbi:MAG TPA: aminomethyl-transferring glycine dehydrogenase subunit GcvPA [Pyrinomonadaceae bacterium]|nr:aminomethyl-transferring glycine dehydrogenase subunit GcvPA [Pyrinomonadaceae bacterium]